MKKYCGLFMLLLSQLLLQAQAKKGTGLIQGSSNGHYLQYGNGVPFFWLGDTAWELFHRLTLQEIDHYLTNRSAKGFTVIQAVVLAEYDGLRKPNQYGDLPFRDLDPTKPNEKYFAFIDTVIKMAAAKNLIIGLLPTWGDKVFVSWGIGPEIFDSTNAYAFGLWLGKRYANTTNIAWIVGGDRPPVQDSLDFRPVWRNMANGILKGTAGRAFIAYHISGGSGSTSRHLHNEPWLHMNMMQSGHGGGHDVPVWDDIHRDYGLQPAKPTLDAEPNYEDHPVNPWPKWDTASGYFRDYDVRKQCYRSVFGGAAGVTYGHHAVWQFYSAREEKINHPDRYWTAAINRPGAVQVGYLKNLILSRPSLHRVPDSTLIVSGQGHGAGHIEAFRDSANRYAMIYLPRGKTIGVNTGFIKTPQLMVWWFNPRTGVANKGDLKKRLPVMTFTPPTVGAGKDWVLVIDAAGAPFGAPGKR